MRLITFGIALIVGSSAAHAMVIDDFTSGAYTDSITSGNSGILSQTGSMLGGIRVVEDAVLSNPIGLTYMSEVTGTGFSAVSSGPLVQGTTAVGWGFNASGVGFDLNADFSAESLIALHVLSNDQPATASVTIWTLSGSGYASDTVTENIPVGVFTPNEVDFNLSSFSGLNFGHVSEIELDLHPGTSGDLVLTKVDTVPEPASMSVLALGLGAVFARRKKRA